jgi:hypothetical protein
MDCLILMDSKNKSAGGHSPPGGLKECGGHSPGG